MAETSRINILLWTTYDIANTIFSMGIVSMTILQYGILAGMSNGLTYARSNLLASIAVSLSTLIVAITIPVMGTLSDNNGQGKPGTILFGALTILFTAIVTLTRNPYIAMALFLFANIFYQWGNLFYDSMIPRISEGKDTGWVSAVGVALGYFGSFFAVAISFLATSRYGEPVTLPDNIAVLPVSEYPAILGTNPTGYLNEMWLLCAVGFLLVALPFILTKENRGRDRLKEEGLGKLVKASIAETVETAHEIWSYRDMRWFVIGWFFTVDVVQTVINIMKPAAVIGLGMDDGAATILLLAGVVFAVLLTGIAGPISDRKGPKTLAYIVSGVWVLALLIPVFVEPFSEAVVPSYLSFLPGVLVYLMAALIGFGMGSIWVVQRTMTVELAPPDKIGQYFGFSKLAGKGSSAVGMILFGSIISWLSVATGSNVIAYKLGIAFLMVLYLIGFSFFTRVGDHHKEFIGGKRAPYGKTQ